MAQRQGQGQKLSCGLCFGPRPELFVVSVATSAFLLPSPTHMCRSPRTSPAYNLLPDRIAKAIPPLGSTGENPDPMFHVKWFTPDSQFSWFVAEYSPESKIAYGFVVGPFPEWGTFSLEEIRQLRGSLNLPVERDLHFTPCLSSKITKEFY